MPRAAPAPDRHAVEASLPAAVRDALPALCAVLGLSRQQWHLCPALARIIETAAFGALVKQFRSDGLTGERARARAAVRLGLTSEHTALARLRRWQTPGA